MLLLARAFRTTARITKSRSNTIVIRFNAIRTRNSVGRYSNSTRFFPAGRRTPVCHSFTRKTGRFLPFTRTFVPWVTVPDFRRSIDGNFEKLRAPWLLDLLNDLPEGTTIGTACHSSFFVIGTDKAQTTRISRRHPILNRAWHRLIYDNEYPLTPYSRQILSQPKAPPLLPGR